MEIISSPLTYALLALFALSLGSLLNVVIYRLPIMMRAEWMQHCNHLLSISSEMNTQLNLFFPRSFCPTCKTTIKAWQNIPLLSYCLQRGRCQFCKASISRRYPLVELLSCLMALFSAWHFGFNLTLVLALVFLWLIIALFFIDLNHQLLPDSLTLGLLWVGLIANTQSVFTTLPNAVLASVGAYLFLWLFIKAFYLLTHKIGMGNGDFKLFAAFGAWFGWTQLPFILLFASLVGAVSGFIYLKWKNQTTSTPIPFGPFLCTAGLISLYWGDDLLHWYLRGWF